MKLTQSEYDFDRPIPGRSHREPFRIFGFALARALGDFLEHFKINETGDDLRRLIQPLIQLWHFLGLDQAQMTAWQIKSGMARHAAETR